MHTGGDIGNSQMQAKTGLISLRREGEGFPPNRMRQGIIINFDNAAISDIKEGKRRGQWHVFHEVCQ